MITTPAQENLEMPTLFSVYGPIESYLDALQTARGGRADGDRAASLPEAIDFFLLDRWIAQYATRPRVLDLASEETMGASTLFFLGNPQVREVQVLPPAEPAAGMRIGGRCWRLRSRTGKFRRNRNTPFCP